MMLTLAVVALYAVTVPIAAPSGEGRVRVGLQAAYGIEQGGLFGSGPSAGTRLAMFQPQLAVAVVRHGGPRLEIVMEPMLGESLSPSKRLFLSMNLGVRAHAPLSGRASLYFESGIGPGSSALHRDSARNEERQYPKLTDYQQFHIQVGAGMRMSLGRWSLQAGYRLTHFSNNRTRLPNRGLNLNTLVVGFHSPAF